VNVGSPQLGQDLAFLRGDLSCDLSGSGEEAAHLGTIDPLLCADCKHHVFAYGSELEGKNLMCVSPSLLLAGIEELPHLISEARLSEMIRVPSP